MKATTIFGTFAAAIVVGVIVGVGGRSSAPRAENASPVFRTALTAEQQQELSRGAQYLTHGDYADAAPILGKYALLGQPAAQSIIGAMYYFGKGFPLDHDEGLKWMRLSAAQNYKGAQLAVAEAEGGTLTWWQALYQPYDPAGGPYSSPSDNYATPLAYRAGSATDETMPIASDGSYGQGDASRPSPPASSLYGGPSSPPTVGAESYEPSRSGMYEPSLSTYDSARSSNAGAINLGTGQYMAPAGSGAYVDPRDGTYYAPSGPDGVVNSRTGEYSPVSH